MFAKLASSWFAAFQAVLPWKWRGFVCMYIVARSELLFLSRELLIYM